MTRTILSLLAVLALTSSAWAQTSVNLAGRTTRGTISANGGAVTLTLRAGESMGSAKFQSLDSYSGTIEAQCSLDGINWDTGDEPLLQLLGGTSTASSVTDTTGIWDIVGAAACRAIRIIATAGFAASDTTIIISFVPSGGGSGGPGGGVGSADSTAANQVLEIAALDSIAVDANDSAASLASIDTNIAFIKNNLSVDADYNVASLTRGPQIMCNGSAAAPTAVGADGRAIQPWCDTIGRLQTNLSQLGGTATPIITATLGDDLANTQDGLAVINLPYLWDGTTWDRAAGNSAGGAFIQGAVGDDVATAGNPVYIGGLATTSIVGQTPATTARRIAFVGGADRVQITRPYANLEDRVSAVVGVTDGSSTSLVSAQGSGVRFCATNFVVSNSSATNVTVDIRDGTGGSVIATFPAAANMGGAVLNLGVPICTTANTAMAMDPSASATTVTVTAVGFKTEL